MGIERRSLVAVLVLGLAACGTPDAEMELDTTAGEAPAPPPAAEPAAPAPDDADIAAIVVVANTLDIRNGEMALEKASNEQVREFAETMIRDHTAVNESAQELVTRLGVTPTMNDVTTTLQTAGDEAHERLMGLMGAEFDRAYLAYEVEYHQTVIDALDNTLIPNATNAELRDALVGVRPAFQAHMEQARTILQQLGAS